MKYTLEDTADGFRLTLEVKRDAPLFRNSGGLSHRHTVEMTGSHNELAEAYAILERVGHSAPRNTRPR